MKIFHSKNYQHVQVEDIDYGQYEAICDQLFTQIPNLVVSTQYRKNLKTAFIVLINQAMTNKVLGLFANPPASSAVNSPAVEELKAKKKTEAKH